MEGTDRVKRLAQEARNANVPAFRSPEGELAWYRSWVSHRHCSSNLVRIAGAKAAVHAAATPVIGDGELIVGRPCYRTLDEEEQAELDGYRKAAAMLPDLGGQASHMAVDYEKLLRLGITGVRAEVETLRAALDPSDPAAIGKLDFYDACLTALDGVLAYARNYAAHARLLADGAEDARRAELLEIAETLDVVPAYPAQTFRQALQSVHFLTFCLEGLYQWGRSDRYLLPYYEEDIRLGRISRDTAQELIDCACVLFSHTIPLGLAVGFLVGGRDAGGQDVCNELTELFLISIGHTRMAYPAIGLCLTPETPQRLVELSCRLLLDGLSHPALFSDDVVTEGLRGYGLPPEEACLYVQSTCVEITPVASSAVWVASPYVNLPQLLLDVIGVPPLGSEAPGPAVEYESYEALEQAFRSHLRQHLQQEAAEQNRLQRNRSLHGGDPLVSCFVQDCLARGLDIDQGGARYNWIMPSFVGLANLADSLTAIRTLVFAERRLTLAELAHALQNDFAGQERLLHYIQNRIPKYGNDEDAADGIVGRITDWIVEETASLKTYRGDRFIPSLFCWIMHELLGSKTAATPDGRRQCFPLGDGSGPAQGRERKGPTASALSSTKWHHSPFIGGIAVNMKFNKSMLGSGSADALAAIVKTFMERGGFELQVNAVDRETLLKARANPEGFGDLVVRIGGYSDYFVRLSPAMQDEVIARTEHGI